MLIDNSQNNTKVRYLVIVLVAIISGWLWSGLGAPIYGMKLVRCGNIVADLGCSLFNMFMLYGFIELAFAYSGGLTLGLVEVRNKYGLAFSAFSWAVFLLTLPFVFEHRLPIGSDYFVLFSTLIFLVSYWVFYMISQKGWLKPKTAVLFVISPMLIVFLISELFSS